MTALTLEPPDRAIRMNNPYRGGIPADARAVIYAAAVMGAVRDGVMTGLDVREQMETVILPRPNLHAINGRVC